LFEKEVYTRSNEILEADLYADPDCLLLEADVKDFEKCLGVCLEELIEKSNIIETLLHVPLFKNLSLNKIEILTETIKSEKYTKGETIIKEGDEGSNFYIVRSGRIDIFVQSQYMRSLNPYEYFGERSLFIQEPRSATAVANCDNTAVYVLNKENFKNIIEKNLKEHLISRIHLQDNTIELKDLDYIQELGAGNFGNVSLVRSKKNKCFYAIKSISKTQIDADQLHKNLDMERGILLQIDHPFIMKMVKTLKDKNNIYFLTEYIKGKELFDVIREIGLLNKEQTLFYGCSMMLAIEYLHKRKFIYRDLKPENILVTETV
jgi:cGMP-dependent protein kinase